MLNDSIILIYFRKSNPNISKFMASKNITEYNKLEEYYIQRLLKLVANLPKKNGFVYSISNF